MDEHPWSSMFVQICDLFLKINSQEWDFQYPKGIHVVKAFHIVNGFPL